jgi:hypothetical protein
MQMTFICERCEKEYKRETYTARDHKSTKEYWRKIAGTEYGLCEDCKGIIRQEKLDAENAEAAKKSAEMEFPALTGSEKQVAWANTLRLEMTEKMQNVLERLKPEKKPEFYRAFDYMVANKTKASWWIDNRFEYEVDLLVKMVGEAPTEKEMEDRKIENDIYAESAVFLENCKYDIPAKITVKDDKVLTIFEKNEKFREVVKSLGYEWSGTRWVKEIRETTGTAAERAAELGNKLLNAGFPISILDKDIRENAINADYEPEHTRWIYRRVNGDYQDWLAITWEEDNEKLYQDARHITGSRWSKPSVVVKPDYYVQVEDFANLYGFRFTKAAQRLLDKAKMARETAVIVKPAGPKEEAKKDGLKDILNSSADVLPDLVDD